MFLHRRGGGSAFRGVCPPPLLDTMGYNQRAGGTHPTGMHFCLTLLQISVSLVVTFYEIAKKNKKLAILLQDVYCFNNKNIPLLCVSQIDD